MIPEKGIDLICKLSDNNIFKNIEFHIWGEGCQYNSKFFNQFPNIIFHGKFEGKKGLLKVIKTIDAYILLSRHPEGLPVSLLEVMSSGKPWVATNQGGIPDIVCNPLTNLIVSDLNDYNLVVKDLNDFVTNLKLNKHNATIQIEQYKNKFSNKILKTSWCNILINI